MFTVLFILTVVGAFLTLLALSVAGMAIALVSGGVAGMAEVVDLFRRVLRPRD